MYNTNSKRKKYNFLTKDWFLEIFDFFFQRGGPFDAKIVKNIFFNFSKFLKQIPKTTLIGLLGHK